MNRKSLPDSARRAAKLALLPALLGAGNQAWQFDRWGELEGWTISASCGGAVSGGALWLRLAAPTADPAVLKSPRFQVYGDRSQGVCELESPPGLAIPAGTVNQVTLSILNLSPATTGMVYWRTASEPSRYTGPVPFAFEPDHKDWQVAVCRLDDRWTGTVDRIKIRFAGARSRGDLWIREIKTGYAPRLTRERPDLRSERVIPQVDVPGIPQNHVADAFSVLDECLVVDVPLFGFRYPFLAPGGAYGANWWQLDTSVNLAGAKWANQQFAEDVMRGFVGVQNSDGRIDLWGGSAVRGQPADSSSLPKFFEAAYDVARRTADGALRLEIYESMRRYLEWWLSPVKRHPGTGLITGIFEETISEPDLVLIEPQTIAPVDLNVAVAVGCRDTASLAQNLGRSADAARYERIYKELGLSINRWLWNEERGAYYNYDVRKCAQRLRLLCTAFDPMRTGIAPPDRVARLVDKLTSPALFNWGRLPVTSIARTEPDYMEATGPYDGRAWFGDVWTLRNMAIIAGLEDVGRWDLAAELAWATIRAFSGNFAEYLVPSTGEGHGVKRYGWSASQYIQALVEHLFGVDYDRLKGRLRVMPRVPSALYGKRLALQRLRLPGGAEARLGVTVTQGHPGQAEIAIQIGGVPAGTALELFLPGRDGHPVRATDERGRTLALMRDPAGLKNVAGVWFPRAVSHTVRFE